MPFATLQDLVDRFGEKELVQRTDRTNRPPTTIDAAVVDQALEGASSLARGYLAKRYALPLPEVPRVLVDKVADIARWQLRDETFDKESQVGRRYLDAMSWLRDVSTGVVQLEMPEGAAPAEAAGGGAVRVASGDRTLTQSSLKGYV